MYISCNTNCVAIGGYILVAWTFVKLSIGHPNDSIGGLNGGTPFGGWQKNFLLEYVLV